MLLFMPFLLKYVFFQIVTLSLTTQYCTYLIPIESSVLIVAHFFFEAIKIESLYYKKIYQSSFSLECKTSVE